MIRICDIVFSLLGLLFLLPILAPVAFILRLTGEKAVFYRQARVGQNMQYFEIVKFATMLKNSLNLPGGSITVKNDPRILPFGKILRSTKINELPQIWNVLVGDMSLIGPRPMTPSNFDFYSVSAQSRIAALRPGLSGVGSIAFRNEEEILAKVTDASDFYQREIAPYKAQLEEWYIQHHSFKIYLLLISLTLISVVFGTNRWLWVVFKDLPKPNEELQGIIQ